MDTTLLLNAIITLAKQAGEMINTLYHAESSGVIQIKADHTPLTQADLAAHQLIIQGLQQLTPSWPILSEEAAAISFTSRKQWKYYWLIDPLDGTKEFLEKNDEFTVNIALVKNHYPILSVVYAPALEICYYAAEKLGAFKQVAQQTPQALNTRKWQPPTITIAVSRHHGREAITNFLQQFKQINIVTCGSALKFCLVAEGRVDIYPRLSPTSEWDTGAAQLILEQAGGAVLTTSGDRLCYNKKKSLVNPHFLAVGDTHHNWKKYFR